MPPWSLIILKYDSSVRWIAPYAPAGPSCGPQLPTTTSVSVTPGTTAAVVGAVLAVVVAPGAVLAGPQAVKRNATSKGTTSAARGTDRFCIFESCCLKMSSLFLPSPSAPDMLAAPPPSAGAL